jgi:multicomponent Na+:H+ antiporter subunit D
VSALVAIPVLLPLGTAAVLLLFWNRVRLQQALSAIGAAGLLAAAVALCAAVWRDGVLAVRVGGWPPLFGITLVADLFAAIMVLLAGAVGLAIVVYSATDVDERRKAFAYHALVQVLLAGVCGAFLTGDLFNLYVWFEVMLVSSFALLALGSERPQVEGSIKYVVLNLTSSALFLAAVGLLYGFTGTLNMAELAVRLRELPDPTAVTPVALLFLVAFGIKAAVFPLFFWLPAAYHTPPPAVSALFAGLLTKVGVYALIRTFTLLFTAETGLTHGLLAVIAALTMVTGVLGAIAQSDVRRILSFHIVSQIGYMVLGLALFAPLALAGSVFYIAHHILVKTNLFLVAGLVRRLGGSFELARLGGLWRTRPAVALLFLVPALSLAGMPPLSGFFAKLVLVRASFEGEHWAIAGVALVVGLLTLYSMTKIFGEAFWKAAEAPRDGEPAVPRALTSALVVPVCGLAATTVLLGILAGPAFAVAQVAARQLLDPSDYLRAVLGAP